MEISYETNCTNISEFQWDDMMKNSRPTHGYELRELIRIHEPELYESLALDMFNPYEHQSTINDKYIVYVHSMIEYFFTYK